MSNDNSGKKLCMQFDMNTIQHLGISMYAKLPPVLAELVANCWDADATEVSIELFDSEPISKHIIISDDGNGMSLDDINEKFLKIGRNRRCSEKRDTTFNNRKVIGRKGIGKLSIFGIAEDVVVTTVRDKTKNQFLMSLPLIKESGTLYYPDHLIVNEACDEKDGTIIELKNLKRKSNFDTEAIVSDLARRFLIFDENFKVSIIYNGDVDKKINVKNELRFNNIDIEFKWKFPNENLKDGYCYEEKVAGEIFTSKKPVPAAMKGIYLVARGKLVHNNDFYGISASDYAHAYLTGWLNVDFIDDDATDDLISTNRESLNWENEKTEKLREYIQKIISFVTQDWRKKRRDTKVEQVKSKTGLDLNDWIQSLPKNDQKLAKKMTDIILNSDTFDSDKSAELVNYIKDSFEFESFKEFAAQIEDSGEENQENFIKLFKDWGLIEAKELYRVAIVRIEAIKKFGNYIKTNAKEVPIMHDFLKEFSWLLDPRIMNFKDEITYSKILKEEFAEEVEPDENKRLDFLCVDFANTFFIIELKRPNHMANSKDLDQALEYVSFIRQHIGNDPTFSATNIEAYIVCGGIADKAIAREKADALSRTNKVYVKTYNELQSKALKYHGEFIEKYEKIKRAQAQ